MLPEFNETDSDGRKYKQTDLPGGSFRMYEDLPYVWTQVLKEGEKSVVEVIEDAFNNGQISKNN
jgi:hypothetical protein